MTVPETPPPPPQPPIPPRPAAAAYAAQTSYGATYEPYASNVQPSAPGEFNAAQSNNQTSFGSPDAGNSWQMLNIPLSPPPPPPANAQNNQYAQLGDHQQLHPLVINGDPVTVNQNRAQPARSDKSCAPWVVFAVFGGIALAALAIGLGVGLSQSSSSNDASNSNVVSGIPPPSSPSGASPESIAAAEEAAIASFNVTVPETDSLVSHVSGGPIFANITFLNAVETSVYRDIFGNIIGPLAPSRLAFIGGFLRFRIYFEPEDEELQLVDLKIWLDNEDQQGVYRLHPANGSLAYASSELQIRIDDVPSGLHVLNLLAHFDGEHDVTTYDTQVFILQPTIRTIVYRQTSDTLTVQNDLIIQLSSLEVPIDHVESDDLKIVFPPASSFYINDAQIGPMMDVDPTNDTSDDSSALFTQQFHISAPNSFSDTNPPNATEGWKTLQLKLFPRINLTIPLPLEVYNYFTLTIEFFYSYGRNRLPLTSKYGALDQFAMPETSFPSQTNLSTDGLIALSQSQQIPVVLRVEPISILVGSISYLNITLYGPLSNDTEMLIGIKGFGGHLQVPVLPLLIDAAELEAAALAASNKYSNTSFASQSDIARSAASPFQRLENYLSKTAGLADLSSSGSHQLYVPLGATKTEWSDGFSSSFLKAESSEVSVTTPSVGPISPVTRSLINVAPQPSKGQLHARLTWPVLNDVDLHAVTPEGDEIFYLNPAAGTGALDVDSNADCNIDGINVENIYWSDPTSGTYTFSAVMYDECKIGASPFLLTVDGCDVPPNTQLISVVPPTQSLTLKINCDHKYLLKGQLQYEARSGVSGGTKQIRKVTSGVKIQVELKDDKTVIVGTGTVNSDGTYEIRLTIDRTDEEKTFHMVLIPEDSTFSVQDYTGAAHRVLNTKSEFVPKEYRDKATDTTAAVLIQKNLVYKYADKSGALNIFIALHQGSDFYTGKGLPLPLTYVYWDLNTAAPGAGASQSLSYMSMGSLYIGGATQDPDEFDESVLLHELGHRMQFTYGPAMVGGPHGGSAYIRPTLAFSEGFATFIGQLQLQRLNYIDLTGGGIFQYNICDPSKWKVGTSNGKSTGKISEVLVTCVLWKLNYGLGMQSAILNQFQTNLKQSGYETKGEAGFADLADFISLLGCPLTSGGRTIFTNLISKSPFGLKWFQETGFCTWP